MEINKHIIGTTVPNSESSAAVTAPQNAPSAAKSPTSPVVPLIPKRSQSSLTANHGLSVNARYGTSKANVLIFAITEYRESRVEECNKYIRSGDFQNAYENHRDAEAAYTILLELALDLSALADKNYWASISQAPDLSEHEQNAHYESWLKEHVGMVPGKQETDSSISQQLPGDAQ